MSKPKTPQDLLKNTALIKIMPVNEESPQKELLIRVKHGTPEEQKFEPFFFKPPKESLSYEPFDVKCIIGYEEVENYIKLPLRKRIFEDVKVWFKKFPRCCDRHKELMNDVSFTKAKYKNVPLKIMKQLSYTEHFIICCHSWGNWYECITRYIDYNTEGFGRQPTVGAAPYL